MTNQSLPDDAKRRASCPICQKPVETPAFRPFCSARCKDVDLGRWFTGNYRIPVTPRPGEELAEDVDD